MSERLLSAREVCEMLQISKSTLRRLLAMGEFIEPYRISSKVHRWRGSDVERWMRERKGV